MNARQLGGETLWQRWSAQAELHPDKDAVVVLRAGEEPVRWHWGALLQAARGYAVWLRSHGVERGHTCAFVTRHHESFYPLYFGVVALGAIPTVLAYPNARLHPDKFRSGLAGMARHSGLDWVLTERPMEPLVGPLVSAASSNIRGILLPYEAELKADVDAVTHAVPPDSPALLQHSSGTTGLQKAVLLSHRAILEHVKHYGDALQIRDDDKVVSWLPLYHDMGLIAAFHMPLALGITTVHLDPFEWVSAPALLIEALSQEQGTLSWLPNFAYSLMGLRLRLDELEGCSLARVRMLINCSEPVRPESHAHFLAKAEQLGLSPNALAASYAMAEATFAVTQTAPGRGCPTLEVSRDALAQGEVRPAQSGEPTRICASSGRVIPGCELRIVDGAGQALPEGRVGEIWLRSVSLFDGYRNQAEKTAAAFREGWYVSGDFGFLNDGDLYVVGRKKDLIIVAGKNLYPEDIEDAISAVEGTISGRSVAFGMEDAVAGTEKVCAIVETELNQDAHRELRARIVAAVQQLDITLSELFFVPPRWLMKSSSGKPSRAANRDRVMSGELNQGGSGCFRSDSKTYCSPNCR